MLQDRIRSLQHLGHQRLADALLEPVEAEPALRLLRLALELALDDVGKEGVQLGAHEIVAVRVRFPHRADGRAGIQHIAHLRGAFWIELVEPDLVGEAVHRLAVDAWQTASSRAFLKMSGSSAASMMASS